MNLAARGQKVEVQGGEGKSGQVPEAQEGKEESEETAGGDGEREPVLLVVMGGSCEFAA